MKLLMMKLPMMKLIPFYYKNESLEFLFMIVCIITSVSAISQLSVVVPRATGSYHIERAVLTPSDSDTVSHSSPINSLVTLLSLRCGEIVSERKIEMSNDETGPVETLSLFWYLFVSVVEYHYEQLKLLPHMGCILDHKDSICVNRPPLPSFQYTLLHQKLTMLNCCIEERANNSRYITDDESLGYEECSSDSEVTYFSDSEDESEVIETDQVSSVEREETDSNEKEEDYVKPEGRGILNWSGWFLAGTDIPCFIPITKDKNILTVIISWILHL